jgi:NAD(P)-dependent dehydrogenase (short-subunit alcohol dehydrogenase family)
VTGGSRGIGAAIAQGLAQQGATVTIMGRNAEWLQSQAQQLGTHAVPVDVTNANSVTEAFAEAERLGGPVAILINNAGAAESASFKRTDLALWQRMLDVNLTGTYLCTQAVVPNMVSSKFGRIVNIASTAGLTGYAYVSAYCAAKHGVIGLTRALAVELAKSGVTVNAVCPGYADTDMVTEAVTNIVQKTGRTAEQAVAELVIRNPQQRLIKPEEVAHAVLYLCLPGSDAMTGQAIAVCGGEIM